MLRALDDNLSDGRNSRSEGPGNRPDVRVLGFVPGNAEHIECTNLAELVNLAIGLIAVDEVINGKYQRAYIPKPLSSYRHRCGETGIQASYYPCCAIKLS